MKVSFKLLFLIIIALVSNVRAAYAIEGDHGIDSKEFSSNSSSGQSSASIIATLTGTTSVCQNSANIVVTFSASGGTAPYTFTYKINSGANQIVTTTSGNSETVGVSTSKAGTYVYTLVSVTDATNTTQPISSQTATITVNPSPAISGKLSVCIGRDTTQLGGSGTPASTSPWKSSNASIATINNTGLVKILAVGTTTITYTNSSGCSTSATLTVNPLPVINFSFVDNQCSSNVVQFTSSVSGKDSCSYLWDFGDSITSTDPNPTHQYSAPGNGTQSFKVTLTVTDDTTGCTQSKQQTITLHQAPDATLTSTADFVVFNGQPTFRTCSNSDATISFNNASTTTITNVNYTINWGDGSPDFVATTWSSATHTYRVGSWILTYTIPGQNGCTIIKKYCVFVGSNPAVSLGNPGNTNICGNSTLTFPITGTENNPPGTTYTVTFNDGSAPQVFNNPPPSSVTHTFTHSSCGTYSSNGYTSFPNSFSANIVATNPCGTSAVGVVPIYVSTPPVADFRASKTTTCTNSPISLSNMTTGASQASADGCLANPKIVWSITPSTGVTLSSGVLGNNFGSSNPNVWSSGTSSIMPQFSIPGTYIVKMETGNNCGLDSLQDTICVEPPLNLQFAVDHNAGCAPLNVTTTNTTDVSKSCDTIHYHWTVTYKAGNCGTSSAYAFTNGTNASSVSPSFQFINPGSYIVTLSIITACGNQSVSDTVTVKKPPVVILNPLADYCGAATVYPTAIISTCTPDTSSLSYAWSFSGGTPSSSIKKVPGAILYNTPGVYPISLTVTNECGISSTARDTFVVKRVPILTNTTLAQTVCSGIPTVPVPLTADASGTTFIWSASATSGISGFISYGTSDSIPTQFIRNTGSSPGTVTYLITPWLKGCSGTAVKYIITVNPAPYFTKQPVSSTVCQGGTATILSVSYTNGTGTPTYQWYQNSVNNTTTGTAISGETNNSYTPPTTVLGTTYYYCIISLQTGGCSSMISNTATVTVNSIPTISTDPLQEQTICVGGTIATPLSVAYTGGAGTASYQWYQNTQDTTNIGGVSIAGATTSTYTPPVFTTPGVYYYYATVTLSGNGCGAITSNVAKVRVVSDPTVTTQPLANQTVCQTASPSDLSVTASGGVGSFAYQWYQNSINSNMSGNIIAGATNATYTPITNTIGKVYYYCVISQPTGPGCIVTSATAEVIVNAAPSITNQPTSSTICIGETPTLLSIAFINGAGTPSYQWYSNSINDNTSGTPIPGATYNNYMPPATVIGTMYYYCIITLSSGGCSTMISNIAQVTINPIPVISSKKTVICSGKTFIVLPDSVGGDIVPIGTTYTWSTPVVNPAGSINGASAQSAPQSSISQTLINTTHSPTTVTYTVTPNSGSCAGSDFNVIITVNPSINPNVTITNSTCYGANNGAIHTQITGGVPFSSGTPYKITWAGPNGFVSSASSITGLAPGIYTLSVDDAGGCPFLANYTVTEPAAIAIDTAIQKDITCFGEANGSISISITGGTGRYYYSWMKNNTLFSTSQNLFNLEPGSYSVSVTDSMGCTPATATYTITEPTPLTVALMHQTNVLCNGSATGAIAVNATGGTPFETAPGVFNYNYSWKGPNGFISNLQNIDSISAGIYTLTVTDQSGCFDTLSVTITQPSELSVIANSTPITCYGSNNGSISLQISGGVPPYQETWSNLASGTYQNNLSGGDYVITVTDANGCQKTVSIHLQEPPVFMINPTVTNVTCHGAQNGSIHLNVSGTPISVIWSDGATSGTNRNNLGPGTYTATISDGSPCDITRSFVIVEPPALEVSDLIKDALACNDPNSGAISLVVTGGTPPYRYLWSNGATTKDITHIQAGTYTVSITDSLSCSSTFIYEVKRPSPLAVNMSIVNDFNCATKQVTAICTANVTGGMPPYQFTWSRGNVSGANNEIMTTSQSGMVTLQVMDTLGCTTSYSFQVTIPETGITDQLIDCNTHLFQFNAMVVNEISGAFAYLWNFGDGTTSTERSPQHRYANPGNYAVQLTITTPSCSSIYKNTITVESLPVLSFDKEAKLCEGDSVTIHVSGANSYLWSNGTTGDSLVITKAGDYSVIGTSLAGCTNTLQLTASYFGLFHYTIQTDRMEVTTSDPQLHVWSESVPFSQYFWDFGDGQSAQGADVVHTYTITKEGYYDIQLHVISPYGCVETATKRIWIVNDNQVNTFTPNGDGINDIFMKGWHIKVYNRNGLLLYDGTDGWDGTYHGEMVPNDTYFYVLYFMSPTGSKTKVGYVTVLR
jgi:gliding motility-associated-like protein